MTTNTTTSTLPTTMTVKNTGHQLPSDSESSEGGLGGDSFSYTAVMSPYVAEGNHCCSVVRFTVFRTAASLPGAQHEPIAPVNRREHTP